MKTPVVGNPVVSKKPVIPNVKRDQGWSFSFKYYKQIPFFGLDGIDPKWFVSLLEKLSEFSKIERDSFFRDHGLKNANRYHKIDWGAQNIPVQKKELNWIDRDILSNDDEFPFLQFQISKALGRVVGFWSADSTVFNIVLLDPKHNLQPAGGRFNYRVDKADVLACKYTHLINKLDEIKSAPCSCIDCSTHRKLHDMQKDFHCENFVYFQLDEEFYEQFRKLTIHKSVRNIIEEWILENMGSDSKNIA